MPAALPLVRFCKPRQLAAVVDHCCCGQPVVSNQPYALKFLRLAQRYIRRYRGQELLQDEHNYFLTGLYAAWLVGWLVGWLTDWWIGLVRNVVWSGRAVDWDYLLFVCFVRSFGRSVVRSVVRFC